MTSTYSESCNAYGDYMKQKSEIADIKTARMRLWAMGIGVFFTGPIASAVYSVKTNNWIPTLVGTGVAIVGVPLATVDLGVTAAFGAPAATITMFARKTMKKREELQVMMPEQADVMLWKKQAG